MNPADGSNAARFLNARHSRRSILRAAGAAGLAAPLVVGVRGASASNRRVSAQGTPAASPMPGGNEPRGPQVDRLLFWTRASPDDPGQPNLFTQLRARADAYTQAIGTEIEIVTVPDADFRPRMSVAAPGGEGPDVFGPVAHDWIGEFALQQIALPIPDGAIDSPNDIQSIGYDLTRVQGTLYAVPLQLESVALIYNQDLVPTPPTTWDELVQMANDLRSGDVYGFGFPLLEQYHEGAFFMGFGSYIFAYENGIFNTDDIGLNNSGGVEAAKFLRDMYWQKQPEMPDAAIDRANMHGVQEGMMEAGQLAMTINGPWREGPLTQAGINYNVAVLPTLPNGNPMKPFVGVQAMLASAYSEKQEAALDFINFLGGTDSAIAIFQADRKVPARLSALQAEEVAANPHVATWAEQITYGEPMPNIAAMSQVWTPWGGAMDAIIPTNAPDDQVQELLDAAVEQIRENIAAFEG